MVTSRKGSCRELCAPPNAFHRAARFLWLQAVQKAKALQGSQSCCLLEGKNCNSILLLLQHQCPVESRCCLDLLHRCRLKWNWVLCKHYSRWRVCHGCSRGHCRSFGAEVLHQPLLLDSKSILLELLVKNMLLHFGFSEEIETMKAKTEFRMENWKTYLSLWVTEAACEKNLWQFQMGACAGPGQTWVITLGFFLLPGFTQSLFFWLLRREIWNIMHRLLRDSDIPEGMSREEHLEEVVLCFVCATSRHCGSAWVCNYAPQASFFQFLQAPLPVLATKG